MASKPGAERFLAPLAKRASAGVTLALALAAFALALAGCGGGAEDPGSESSTAASSAEGGAGDSPSGPSAAAAAKGQAKAKQGAKGAAEGNGAGGSQAGSQGQAGAGQKQGPRVTVPQGAPEQAPSADQVAQATLADMSLQSPAIAASTEGPGALPATYTCDGAGSWPELRWSGVPPDSAELILYAMSVQPVEGKLFVDWALAGLDPALTGIAAGELPKGAVVGTNSFGERGYEICPPAGGAEIYMFAIYALPQRLSPPKGFDARELRKEILAVSGNVGLLPAVYARG